MKSDLALFLSVAPRFVHCLVRSIVRLAGAALLLAALAVWNTGLATQVSEKRVPGMELSSIGPERTEAKGVRDDNGTQSDENASPPSVAQYETQPAVEQSATGSTIEATATETDEELEQQVAPKWDYSLRTSLTGSQASYRNWSQGGIDNLSVTATTGLSAGYKKENMEYSLSVNLRYGQTKVGDGDFVKSDDRIRIRNQVRRLFRDERFSTVFNVNLDTQFDLGYDRPVPVEGETRKVISRFFAPAYLSEVVGLSYNPDRNLRFEAGLAMRQTFVTDTALSVRYGLDEGATFRNEAGFSLFIGYERRIMESIFYSGYVETFTNVNKSLASSDVTFVSEITGQINRYISANLEIGLAYNDDVSSELQVKQIISVGFSYQFFDN